MNENFITLSGDNNEDLSSDYFLYNIATVLGTWNYTACGNVF